METRHPLPPVTTIYEPHPLRFVDPLAGLCLVTLVLLTTVFTVLFRMDAGWSVVSATSVSMTLTFLAWRFAIKNHGAEISWDSERIWFRKAFPWQKDWSLSWDQVHEIKLAKNVLLINPQDSEGNYKLKMPVDANRTQLIVEIGKRLVDNSKTETSRPFEPRSARLHLVWKHVALVVASMALWIAMTVVCRLYLGDPFWLKVLVQTICQILTVSLGLMAYRSYRAYKNAPLGNPDKELDDLFYDRYGNDAPHIARFYRHVWSHGGDFYLDNLPDWKPKPSDLAQQKPKTGP